jgi:two-component system NtrC family response regulator
MDRRILVVDDSEPVCVQLSRLLARPDRRIKVAHDGTEALEWLMDGNFSLVLTDLRLPGISGLDLIREVRGRNLPLTVIVMTGHGSIDSAVEAMKLGAYDYIHKPVDPDLLQMVVDQALSDRRLQDELAAVRQGINQRFGFHDLRGRGPRMREVFSRIAKIASQPCNVLVTGETGTGKDLVAHALHNADTTRSGALVTINCAALPEPLLESELFGHEQGAFTGADHVKPGRFELANGGTLFLDEIGELPLAMQAKLLRVLQEGTFERVGGTTVLRTDARVLAATNLDLSAAVASGRFREDLYYRLNVVSIDLPPLRERMEDLPLLVDHFLARLQERRMPAKTFAREALSHLASHDWPGNVRELEHLIERLVVTAPGPVIMPDDLPSQIVSSLREEPLTLDFDLHRPLQAITDELTERIERHYLRMVLEKYRGRIDACAAHCGLSRRSISEKLRRYSIDKSVFKSRTGKHRSASTRALASGAALVDG